MPTLKYSRQREAIKSFLMNTTSHPTADEVYAVIRATYPNVSLGTVYRNLNLLVEQGEAVKLATEGGSDHFDGNPKPHYHFLCDCCERVFDVPMALMPQLDTLAQVGFEGTVRAHNLMFFGECPECKKNKKNC